MAEQPEPQLFNLTLSNRAGQYVGILIDEAVSEDPEFLVSAMARAKQALAAMPPKPHPAEAVIAELAEAHRVVSEANDESVTLSSEGRVAKEIDEALSWSTTDLTSENPRA